MRTRKDDFPGVIGSKPPHELPEEERKQLPDIDGMFIDIGCHEGFDVNETLGVRPGDPVVRISPFTMLAGNLMMTKAWDDRSGCGILIEAARLLEGREHPNTTYFVGGVQEEVGLRGARTAAEVVRPDVAFALDVSLCYKHPDKSRKDLPERLGNGAAILVHDSTMDSQHPAPGLGGLSWPRSSLSAATSRAFAEATTRAQSTSTARACRLSPSVGPRATFMPIPASLPSRTTIRPCDSSSPSSTTWANP